MCAIDSPTSTLSRHVATSCDHPECTISEQSPAQQSPEQPSSPPAYILPSDAVLRQIFCHPSIAPLEPTWPASRIASPAPASRPISPPISLHMFAHPSLPGNRTGSPEEMRISAVQRAIALACRVQLEPPTKEPTIVERNSPAVLSKDSGRSAVMRTLLTF